jgi:hypothetical protein
LHLLLHLVLIIFLINTGAQIVRVVQVSITQHVHVENTVNVIHVVVPTLLLLELVVDVAQLAPVPLAALEMNLVSIYK